MHCTGKWSKQPDNEPSTKYELVWSGDLALEEGYVVFSTVSLKGILVFLEAAFIATFYQ